MKKFELTITFEDGEVIIRKYANYEKAIKVSKEYGELKTNGTYSIKSVHIKEI